METTKRPFPWCIERGLIERVMKGIVRNEDTRLQNGGEMAEGAGFGGPSLIPLLLWIQSNGPQLGRLCYMLKVLSGESQC